MHTASRKTATAIDTLDERTYRSWMYQNETQYISQCDWATFILQIQDEAIVLLVESTCVKKLGFVLISLRDKNLTKGKIP